MTSALLNKETRMKFIKIREDYLEIFREKPELRVEDPALWHQVVDQYDLVTQELENDEAKICQLTTTRKLDDENQLMIKKLDGVEHPLGKWEMANG